MLHPDLSPLESLATNLWWTTSAAAHALFEHIDPVRWEVSRQNPVALLHDVEQARWTELAGDASFVRRVNALAAEQGDFLRAPTWADGVPGLTGKRIAYFSMEYGLHQSLRIYSGGLGVLAGDHVRSVSDLGVPLVGVGLLYREGYFRQVFDDGLQSEAYPVARFGRLPVRLCTNDAGPIRISVDIGGDTVSAQIWRLAVGRTALYLLDTDHDGNPESLRPLTRHLYGGDETLRIRQEVLLGIGGQQALAALDLGPDLVHLNEGHCAFAPLVWVAQGIASGQSFDEAVTAVRSRCVFTTHTPVPAGHDRFSADLVRAVLGPWCAAHEVPAEAVIDLGRVRPGDADETLCMTVVAMRMSRSTNGVAALHGEVSREMWKELWPDLDVADVPIGHVTNGVHPFFWMAPPARALFDEHLPGWRDAPWDPEIWAGVEGIDDGALWQLRSRCRTRLLDAIRTRTGRIFDPDALTIGFARRFAPYKRGDLIFSDPDRLRALLQGSPGVQLVFAGKAHPKDTGGKQIIQNVLYWANHAGFRDRVVLLEDYDIALGGLMTSGCDVWLNNPRRPREASGTSGQKVVLNGGLNLSVLDGWWPEGFEGDNGWQIGDGRIWEDTHAHDAHDTESLYATLEGSVLPEWASRDEQGIPRAWIARMKRSIATCAPKFTSHRMVRDYVNQVYLPALESSG